MNHWPCVTRTCAGITGCGDRLSDFVPWAGRPSRMVWARQRGAGWGTAPLQGFRPPPLRGDFDCDGLSMPLRKIATKTAANPRNLKVIPGLGRPTWRQCGATSRGRFVCRRDCVLSRLPPHQRGSLHRDQRGAGIKRRQKRCGNVSQGESKNATPRLTASGGSENV